MTAPEVTVALLTKTGGETLPRILDALRDQKTSRSVEILAVDSGSTDGTLESLQAAGARVLTISPREFDFGLTRDLAYRHAHGAIVVNLSQDAVPAHNRWLESLIAPLNDPLNAVSCGRSIPDASRATRQFPWERNGRFYFTREMRRFARRYGRGISFANSAVRRSAWEALRFDRQILGEDYQFQTKLHAAGLRVAFPDGAEVLHHHDYTMASLYRRCRDEGRALRTLGCAYGEADLILDCFSPTIFRQWLREWRHGRMQTPADVFFPWIRPFAVYAGSRFHARRDPEVLVPPIQETIEDAAAR